MTDAHVARMTGAMRPQLEELWLDAFPGDGRDEAARFIDRVGLPAGGLVWLEDGRPVSMTFTLPAELMAGERALPVQYIYAAATLMPWRGRGIFGRLLAASHRRAADAGLAASFLRPAGSGLFAYYARFGYRPFFYVEEIERANDQAIPAPAVLQEKPAGRDDLLCGWPVWVRWPPSIVEYAEETARRAGGGIVRTPGGWVLCDGPRDGILQAREWLEATASPPLLAAAAARFVFDKVVLRRPAADSRTAAPFGMLCPLSPAAEALAAGRETDGRLPYMGLALD